MASAPVINVILNTTSASNTLQQFQGQLNGLNLHINQTTNQFNQMGSAGTNAFGEIRNALMGLVGAYGLTELSRGITDTIREFEALKASLKTVTGSEAAGGAAFEMIKEFAATTPFQLKEVTDAFNIMSRVGIVPTREELKAFGNIAAGMNKPITQFAEAVADAVTGEFERLKEFGVKASQSVGQVAFTFRGHTDTIKNNAKAIEDYLKTLGETKFATGLEDQAKTLNGAISNIKDNFELFAYEIGEGGLRVALYNLSTDFMALSGTGQVTARQIGSALASAIELLRSGLKEMAPYAEEAKAALVGLSAGAIAIGIRNIAVAAAEATVAIGSMSLALLATPVGWIATAVAGAAAAIYYFRDAEVQVGTETTTVWTTVLAIYDDAKERVLNFVNSTQAAFAIWKYAVNEGIITVKTELVAFLQLIGAPDSWVEFVNNSSLSWTTMETVAVQSIQTIIEFLDTFLSGSNFVFKTWSDQAVMTFYAFAAQAKVAVGSLWDYITTGSDAAFANMGRRAAEQMEKWIPETMARVRAAADEALGKTPATDAIAKMTSTAKQALDDYTKSIQSHVAERRRQAELDSLIEAANKAAADSMRSKGEAELAAMRNQNAAAQVDKEAAEKKKQFVDQLKEEIFQTQMKIATVGMDQTASANYISSATATKLAVDDSTRAQVDYLNALRNTLEQKQREADFTKYIDNLREETNLLGLNKNEREVQMKLMQANRQFNNELSAEQRATLEDAVRANQQATQAAQERDKAESEAAGKIKKDQQDLQYEYKRTGEVAAQTSEDIAKSLYDAAVTGTSTVQAVLRTLVVGVANIMKAAFSRTEANFFTEFFSSIGGNFRAEGGPVQAGQPYIVGEKRAELFVPSTNGYILPSVPTTTNESTNTFSLSMNVSVGNLPESVGGGLTDAQVRELSSSILKAVHKKLVIEQRYGGVLA